MGNVGCGVKAPPPVVLNGAQYAMSASYTADQSHHHHHHHHHHFRLLKADRTQLIQYMQRTPISNVNDNVNDNT